jgi:hypothetical protein
MKEKLESTTSYFTDEDDAVRDFTYSKVKSNNEYSERY